jgi:hypothetical protein
MRTEAIARTQDVVFEALSDLGISLDLKGKEGASFYAVIDNGIVTEEIGSDAVSLEGVFSTDAKGYYIKSVAADVGDECIINIDGEDYAVNKRGLNFVIYDLTTHEVVDSARFDVSPKHLKHPTCITDVTVDGDSASFKLSKLRRADEVMRDSARLEIWDSHDPDKVLKYDFKLNEDETFTGTFDISGIDTSDCHVGIFINNGKTLVEKLSVKWDGELEELVNYRYVKY